MVRVSSSSAACRHFRVLHDISHALVFSLAPTLPSRFLLCFFSSLKFPHLPPSPSRSLFLSILPAAVWRRKRTPSLLSVCSCCRCPWTPEAEQAHKQIENHQKKMNKKSRKKRSSPSSFTHHPPPSLSALPLSGSHTTQLPTVHSLSVIPRSTLLCSCLACARCRLSLLLLLCVNVRFPIIIIVHDPPPATRLSRRSHRSEPHRSAGLTGHTQVALAQTNGDDGSVKASWAGGACSATSPLTRRGEVSRHDGVRSKPKALHALRPMCH